MIDCRSVAMLRKKLLSLFYKNETFHDLKFIEILKFSRGETVKVYIPLH